MGFPYTLFGDLVALTLAALAFYWAERKGRIILIVIVSLTYLLPKFFSFGAVSLICLIVRYMTGIGSYIYLKAKGRVEI